MAATELLLRAADVVYPDGGEDLKGSVAAELRIDAEGMVADVEVIFGNPVLAEAAVAAFRQYKFKPFLKDGKPVECLVSASAVFQGRSAGAKLFLTPMRFPVGQAILDGNKIRDVQPLYPPAARLAHIQGDVVLRAIINKQGTIESIALVSGHPVLARAAVEAVKQWRYDPYLFDGKPVEVDTVITVKFHL